MLTIILSMCEYARGGLSKYLSEFTGSETSTISIVLEIMVSFVSGWIVAVVILSPGSLTDLVVVAPPFVVVIAIAIIALVYSKFEKNTSEILRYSRRVTLEVLCITLSCCLSVVIIFGTLATQMRKLSTATTWI